MKTGSNSTKMGKKNTADFRNGEKSELRKNAIIFILVVYKSTAKLY
jgi:hypothetical protein